ncbi:SH3 domain-containing protein [Rhodobacter capsulatus]|uniref:SH3 domain-containing protein n=1 Tax=Rhodobacter capsulatus TaxID=1061 RepID=UPI0040252BA3
MTIFDVLAQFCCARDRERRLSTRLPGVMLALTLGLGTLPAPAQEIDDEPPPTDEAVAQALATQSGRGPVTNLPLPRYVSLKGSEGNARRGPSLSHRIDWVFTHAGMPLRVTAEFGHWRRVEDRDGAGGWVHYSLISGVRTVIVEDDMTELHARADAKSAVVALAEMGAVAKLGDCTIDWCEISAEEADGWVPKTAIWGVDPDEIRD